MTSARTNASKHWVNVTLDALRLAGMGSVKYMNVLYVVEVYLIVSLCRPNNVRSVPWCKSCTASDS